MQDGSGELITPFSKFVDLRKISSCLKDKSRAATPSTVSKIINLTSQPNKRNLKTYLRDKLFPLNHDIRTVLFKMLIKRVDCNETMFGEEMFVDFVSENGFSSSLKTIPLPSFVVEPDELPTYYLNNAGVLQMKRILACIGHYFPQVSSCPLLPFAVALLLHYDDEPSQVYSHACRLIFSNSKSVHYLDQTREESKASAILLKELCQKFTPTSHKSLTNLTSDPESVYNHWINCLFLGLSFPTVVVLFDMYLLEGYKALYRVALAVLKFYRKIGISNPSDIVSAVFHFCQTLDSKINNAGLFRKAFSFKLMPSKDIKKMHKKILSTEKTIHSSSSGAVFHRNPWDYLSLVKNVQSTTIDENQFSTLYCWIPETVALNKPTLLFSTDRNGYNMQTFFSCVGVHEPTILLVKALSDEVFGAYLSSSWEEGKENPGFFGTGETCIFTLSPTTKVYKWTGVANSSVLTIESPGKSVKKEKSLPPVKPPAGIRDSRTVTLPPIHHSTASYSVSPVSLHKAEQVTLPPLVGTTIAPKPKQESKCSVPAEMFMMVNDSGIMVGGGGGGYGIFIDSQLRNGTSSHCTTFDNKPLVAGEEFTCSVVEVFGFEGTL